MYIRQATPETYREVLKDVRQKEIYKLIIDTNSQHMAKFFRAVSSTHSLHWITDELNKAHSDSAQSIIFFVFEK